MSEISEEVVQDAMREDQRLRMFELSLQAGEYIREGAPLFAVMRKLRKDADEAMAEFAFVNPADVLKIQDLQARTFRYIVARQTFDYILMEGQLAVQSLRDEDTGR